MFFVKMYTGRPFPEGTKNHNWATIGNFDQDSVDSWYINLKQFSIGLNEQIVAYCEKAEQKTLKNINEVEWILKQKLKKEDYEEIKSTTTSCNQETLTAT